MLRGRLGTTSPLRRLEMRRARNAVRAGFLKRLARPSPIVSRQRRKRRKLNPNSFKEIAKRAGLKDLVSMLMSPKEKMERRLKEPSWDESSSFPVVSQEKPEPWIDQMKRKKRMY